MHYFSQFIPYSTIKYNLLALSALTLIVFTMIIQYGHQYDTRQYLKDQSNNPSFLCEATIDSIKVSSMIYQSYGSRLIACNHRNIELNVTIYHYGIAYHHMLPGHYIVQIKLNRKSLSNPFRPLAFNLLKETKIKNEPPKLNQLFVIINSWRYKNANKIWLAYGPSQILAIIIAITFGIRCYLNKQSWLTLQYTGTSHMISLAGLHIGVIIIITQYIIKKLTQLLPRSSFDSPIILRYIQLTLILLILLAYLLATGSSIPCSRAFYMVMIYFLIELIGINIPLLSILIISSCCIALFAKEHVFNISFIMSYYIMIFIIFSNMVKKKQSLIKSLLKLQITITIACIPLSLYYFNNYSMIGFLVNILAVPCLELIFMPLSLLLLLSTSLFSIAHSFIIQLYLLCFSPFLSMLTWASKLPFATISYHPTLMEFLAQTLCISCLLAPKASYHKPVVIVVSMTSLTALFLISMKSIG